MVVDANPGAGDVGKFGQVEVRSRSGVLLNEPTGTGCGLGCPGLAWPGTSAAWNNPILSITFLGTNPSHTPISWHFTCMFLFTVQYLGYRARISKNQSVVSFLAWYI